MSRMKDLGNKIWGPEDTGPKTSGYMCTLCGAFFEGTISSVDVNLKKCSKCPKEEDDGRKNLSGM